MPLTPNDVRNVAFKKPPIGRRGYDEEEVDAFLDEVERALIELNAEIARLKNNSGSGWSAPTAVQEMVQGAGDDMAQIKAALARIEARLGAVAGPTSVF
jgi:DivIVA domain-containing protein